MGYSNNKWRKILTILMIINLCFILFAKFTKVFGAFSVTYDNIDIPITDNFINTTPYYAIFASDNSYTLPDNATGHFFTLFRSNSPIQMRVLPSGATRLIAFNLERNGLMTTTQFGTFNNTIFPDYMRDTTFTTLNNTTYSVNNGGYDMDFTCILTNHDIKNIDNNSEVLYPNSTYNAPFFDNKTEIENGNPDGVFISPGEYSKNDNLYFHLLEINTGLSNANNSLYYYSDKTIVLNKDSDYYSTWVDPSIDGFYYYIPRYKLGLSQNTSYLYVLNNSKEQIQNSNGLIEKDVSNGIYDVVQSDTAGVITATEEETDRMKNIEAGIYQNQETTNNINDSLTNTTVTEETETDIDGSLSFNNQNEGLNNLNGGFFTRLTTMLSNLLGYNLAEDTSVSFSLPNSNKSLTLHSIDIYNNVNGALRLIINAFWVYIFSFYMWKFINKIYIAVSTGNILDTFSSSGEAITNDML